LGLGVFGVAPSAPWVIPAVETAIALGTLRAAADADLQRPGHPWTHSGSRSGRNPSQFSGPDVLPVVAGSAPGLSHYLGTGKDRGGCVVSDPVDAAARELLRSHQARGLSSGEVSDFYDGLRSVPLDMMRGTWKGSGLHSGHPFDGCLERFGWFGKRFDSTEDVFPLLFPARSGRPFAVEPRFLPFGLAMRLGLTRSRGAAAIFKATRGALQTRRPSARLRMVEYRGVVTASMVYDSLPIIDVFRRIDDGTVVGAMDYRGFQSPFYFVLERCTP
jgi:hypothetical protein